MRSGGAPRGVRRSLRAVCASQPSVFFFPPYPPYPPRTLPQAAQTIPRRSIAARQQDERERERERRKAAPAMPDPSSSRPRPRRPSAGSTSNNASSSSSSSSQPALDRRARYAYDYTNYESAAVVDLTMVEAASGVCVPPHPLFRPGPRGLLASPRLVLGLTEKLAALPPFLRCASTTQVLHGAGQARRDDVPPPARHGLVRPRTSPPPLASTEGRLSRAAGAEARAWREASTPPREGRARRPLACQGRRGWTDAGRRVDRAAAGRRADSGRDGSAGRGARADRPCFGVDGLPPVGHGQQLCGGRLHERPQVHADGELNSPRCCASTLLLAPCFGAAWMACRARSAAD